MNSEQFERGETVEWECNGAVTFIASDGDLSFVKMSSGAHSIANTQRLRKLQPPFAVVQGHYIALGDGKHRFHLANTEHFIAEIINAAFTARLAEEKAGAK